MRASNLIGISANQIWVSARIFVTELRKTKYRKKLIELDPLRFFINPTIIWYSKKQIIMYEGCWSVAYSQLFAPVKRSEKIIIEAYNEKGELFQLKADGLLSRVIQHEYDHLEGIVFTEKITDYKKIMSAGEYRKMKQ